MIGDVTHAANIYNGDPPLLILRVYRCKDPSCVGPRFVLGAPEVFEPFEADSFALLGSRHVEEFDETYTKCKTLAGKGLSNCLAPQTALLCAFQRGIRRS